MGNLKQETISQEKLQTALEYIKLGWHVLPLWQMVEDKCACGNANCKSPGKHPISHLVPHGQNSAATDEQTVTNWWTHYPDANIGVYLAPSNLCAVGIDVRHGGDYTMEELEGIHGKTDSDVLQLTGGGGEHRVFKLPEGVKLPGTLGKGIDLKSNGYIVVEPSNHVSGGAYEWEASSNPLEGCEPSDLPEWILNIANASSSSPVEAGGEPINFGMTSDQYEDVLAALPFIPADERDMWTKVGMALHSTNDGRAYDLWCQWSATSDKYDHKDQFRVWRSFKHKGLSGYDLATVFYLAQENGWVNRKKETLSVEPITIDDGGKPFIEEVISLDTTNPVDGCDETPERLLTTPVKELNEFMEWAETRSGNPQKEISVLAALSLASVLAGRMYLSEQSNTSSLYFMLLAPTGMGKNYARTSIKDFLGDAGLERLVSGSGNTSSGAVMFALWQAPCHIQIVDEVGKLLASARKSSNGQMAEALATMTEAYSSTTNSLKPKNYSQWGDVSKGKAVKKESVTIYWPAITQLSIGTLGQVFDNLTTGEIEDGFLNRQIVMIPSEPMLGKKKIRDRPIPPELLEWAYKIRNPDRAGAQDLTGMTEDSGIKPIYKTVLFETKAEDLFDDFGDGIDALAETGKLAIPELAQRWRENSMRLATALAVCKNSERPIITEEIAEWSVCYIWHYGSRFMKVASTKVADSDHHRLYLNIVELVERSKSKGMTERDMSTYSRLFQSARPYDRNQAIDALMMDKRIMRVEIPNPSGRGRKRRAFICPEYFEDGMTALN